MNICRICFVGTSTFHTITTQFLALWSMFKWTTKLITFFVVMTMFLISINLLLSLLLSLRLSMLLFMLLSFVFKQHFHLTL
jgi:hypothetical protein